MSSLDAVQTARTQAAMEFWNNIHNNQPVFLDLDISTEEFKAVALASTYLLSKNIKVFDFNDSEHRKYYDIAKQVNDNITPSHPVHATLALEFKEVKKCLDTGVLPEFHHTGAGKIAISVLFPNKRADQITIEDLTTAYPGGISHNDIPALLRRGVSEEVRLHLIYMRLDQMEQLSPEEHARGSLIEEFVRQHPEGIPLETALSILEKGANKSVEKLLLRQMSSDLEIHKGVAKDVGRELPTEQIVSQFASEFSKVIHLYNQQENASERGRQERKKLSDAFDAICKSLDLRFNLQDFRTKNYSEIVDLILRQGVPRSIGEEAQQISEITREISEESDVLSRRIEACLKDKDNLDEKTESFKQLNQDLKNFYNKKLKKLNSAVKIVGALQLVASLSHTIAVCLPHPAIVAATAVTAALLGAVSGKIESYQKKVYNRASHTFEKADQTAHLLGYLSDQNLNELLALQGSRREEFAYLIANRHFIKPSVYSQKIKGLEEWLEKDKADLKDELNKNNNKKKKIDDQIVTLKKKQFFEDSSSKKKEIDLQIIELEAELSYLDKRNRECTENASKDDKVLHDLEEEKKLAEYVTPLTRIQEALLDEQAKSLPDKETQRFREAFAGVLGIQRAIAMEGFLTRSMIYDALAPIAGHLEFIAAENNWETGVFKNAPHLLGLVRDAEALRLHYSSIDSFIKLCEETKAKYKKKLGNDYGKLLNEIGWPTVISQYFCPLLGMIGTAMGAGISLYRIHHPAKDKTVAFLDEVMRCQTGLLRNLYQALSQQNQAILTSIQENTAKILLRIKKGNDRVISHVDQSHFFSYEQKISELQHKLQAKARLLKFPSYLARARDEYFNGRQVMKNHVDLTAVIDNPTFYSGFLFSEVFQEGNDLPNVALFLSMVNRALELRKETASLSKEEKVAARQFVTESLRVIREFSRLLNNSYDPLTKALQSKVSLIEAIKKHRLDTSRPAPAKTRALKEVSSWDKPLSLSGADKFAINRMIHEKRFVVAGLLPFSQSRYSLHDFSLQTGQVQPYNPIPHLFAPGQALFNTVNPPRIFRLNDSFLPPLKFKYPIVSTERAFTKPTTKYAAGTKGDFLLEYALGNSTWGNQIQFSLTTTGNSAISAKEITGIPTCSINLQEYAAKVNKMAQTHLGSIRQASPCTLPSKNKEMIPLTFPQELLDNLTNSLSSISFSLETLRVGRLTPTSYDLSFSTNPARYELTIQYSIDFQKNSVENPLFCEFVVATFDFHTVHSFSTYESDTADKLVTDHHRNEFLLQAMYGGSHGLGLAGKGTYSTAKPSSIVYAPVEREFPGLYKLFQAFPNSMKEYDSKENDTENFGPMTRENITNKYGANKHFSAKPFEVRYNADNYLSAWAEISLNLEEFETQQAFKEYKRHYQLFFALCHLSSDTDKETLQNRMGVMLGLTSPDDLHSIVMETGHDSNILLQWERFCRICNTNKFQDKLASLEGQLLDFEKSLSQI